MASPPPVDDGQHQQAADNEEASPAKEQARSAQDTAEDGAQGHFSGIAAKTVANIRRLQENVTVNPPSNAHPPPVPVAAGVASAGWSGNRQVPIGEAAKSPTGQSGACFVQQASGAKKKLPAVLPSSSKRPSCSSSKGPPQSPLPRIPPSLSSSFNALVTIDPNWQSTKRTVTERNAVMCNNALMADVYFAVGAEFGPAKKVPAHKYVLATGSTVFYAMFYGGLAEERDVIEVPDVEPAAFLSMLRYLYCDEVTLTNDNVLATLYCAKRYLVPQLAEECVAFLERSLTAANACVLLSQARLFGEPGLAQRAWEVIDAQAAAALEAESLTDVDPHTLSAVLARESLNCRETSLYHAALRWAAAKVRQELEEQRQEEREEEAVEEPVSPSSLRQALGDALHLIRFPAMTVEEFADEVVKSGLLSLQETTDIFMHFTAKEKPRVPYPTKARIGLQMQVCRRFQSSAYRSNQWRYRGRCDSIQFCVDRRVFIVGFGLYGSSSGSSDYAAKIELKDNDGGVSMAANACKFFSDGSSKTFQVFFEQPAQVEPDRQYTASVVLDGAELAYFGQEGMAEVSSGAVTFQFQCSAESTNGTGVQGGQIPELLFYGPPAEEATKTPQASHKSQSSRGPSRTPSQKRPRDADGAISPASAKASQKESPGGNKPEL